MGRLVADPWARNLLDKNYYDLLTAAPGNSGLYVGQVGDERTAGRDHAPRVQEPLTDDGAPSSGAPFFRFSPFDPSGTRAHTRDSMIRRLMQVAAMVAALLVPGSVSRSQGQRPFLAWCATQSGGAIPGAAIRVVNEGTSTATAAVSGDGGVYRVEGLAPGATAWRPCSTASRRRSRGRADRGRPRRST